MCCIMVNQWKLRITEYLLVGNLNVFMKDYVKGYEGILTINPLDTRGEELFGVLSRASVNNPSLGAKTAIT
jgi:hypothetical protein